MNKEIIYFEIDDLEEYAWNYFFRASGLNRENEQDGPLLEEAMDLGREIKAGMRIKALVSAHPSAEFSFLRGVGSERAYIYILAVEVPTLEKAGTLLGQYFTETWENAYVNGGLKALEDIFLNHFRQNHSWAGSTVEMKHFAPGLGPVALAELERIFMLLEGQKIGVRLTENKLMVPVKSHAGLFIAEKSAGKGLLRTSAKVAERPCASCHLDNSGCRFCIHFSGS